MNPTSTVPMAAYIGRISPRYVSVQRLRMYELDTVRVSVDTHVTVGHACNGRTRMDTRVHI
jgi:hypothetical protein